MHIHGTADAMIHVSSAFDGGNIEVVSANKADDIQLRIQKDNASEFFQWFCSKRSSDTKLIGSLFNGD